MLLPAALAAFEVVMANETDIANMALAKIGSNDVVTAIDTSTPKGRWITILYPQARDEVLETAGVEFRETYNRAGPLASNPDQPTFGWDYAYNLPNDCMRVLGMTTGDDNGDILLESKWKRQGNLLLTQLDEAYILYIKDETNPGTFKPSLVEAIASNLAAKLCLPINGDTKRAQLLLQAYEQVALPNAIAVSNAEGFVRDEDGDNDWIEAGRGG